MYIVNEEMARYVRGVVFSLRVGFSSNDNRVTELTERNVIWSDTQTASGYEEYIRVLFREIVGRPAHTDCKGNSWNGLENWWKIVKRFMKKRTLAEFALLTQF